MLESLRRWMKTDSRIRVQRLEENLGISENTNHALRLATGDFIALVDHDDVLAPFALYELASAVPGAIRAPCRACGRSSCVLCWPAATPSRQRPGRAAWVRRVGCGSAPRRPSCRACSCGHSSQGHPTRACHTRGFANAHKALADIAARCRQIARAAPTPRADSLMGRQRAGPFNLALHLSPA